MKFHEKLKRRVQELGLNKAKAARDAGLPESTISSYLAKDDSLPRMDIALKIARAIGVPLEWLADDAQDWPPPVKTKTLASLFSDEEMMREVAIRYRRDSLRVVELIELIDRTDWEQLTARLLLTPHADPMPEGFQPALRALESLLSPTLASFVKFAYDVRRYAREHHKELPGADRSIEELEPEIFAKRGRELTNTNFFRYAAGYFMERQQIEGGSIRLADAENRRILTVAEIEKGLPDFREKVDAERRKQASGS